MSVEIYSATYQLNFTQCYSNGLLKYSELSNLLQLTAAEHAEIMGFGYKTMVHNNQAWVLSRVRIEIAELPKFLQEITIHTWIEDFMGNRSIRNFEVFVQGKKIVGATTFWAVFNTKERKSENLAMIVDPRLTLPNKKATQQPFRRIDQQENYEQQAPYTIRLSDLDIVQHANNVKYTDWCLDNLAVEQVLKKTFTALDINYIKELNLGQEVIIAHSYTSEKIHFKIGKNDKTVFLMEVEL